MSAAPQGSKWYSLNNFVCPAEGCTGKQKGNWSCTQDSTETFIAQTGYMRCNQSIPNGCWAHEAPIISWGWDCGNHGDHPTERFRRADQQGFGFALSQAVSMLGEAGSVWVGALINEIGRQFGN